MDRMGAPDVGDARLGKTEKSHLPLLNQVTHRAGYLFDRHRRIDAMLIEQVDIVGAQPLQRALRRLANVLGPARSLDADLLSVYEAKTKLGGDYDLVAPPLESPSEQLLVCARTIDLGRVEEVASQFDGAMQCGDRFSLVRRTVGLAHAHATETDRRHLEALAAKFASAHRHGCVPPINQSNPGSPDFECLKVRITCVIVRKWPLILFPTS